MLVHKIICHTFLPQTYCLPPGLGAAGDTRTYPVKSLLARMASLQRQESGMAGPEPRLSDPKVSALSPP